MFDWPSKTEKPPKQSIDPSSSAEPASSFVLCCRKWRLFLHRSLAGLIPRRSLHPPPRRCTVALNALPFLPFRRSVFLRPRFLSTHNRSRVAMSFECKTVGSILILFLSLCLKVLSFPMNVWLVYAWKISLVS